MKVYFSPLAEKKIILLLDYLETEWSVKTRNAFLSKLRKKIHQISKFPMSCVRSKDFPNLFKCVVSKQTTFFYRVMSGEIEIITLIDNRQNPDQIKQEIASFYNGD